MGLNGSRIHIASVAAKRNISLPLLTTTNVWKRNFLIISIKKFNFKKKNLPVDLYKTCQYPREGWRPIPEGSCPAFE